MGHTLWMLMCLLILLLLIIGTEKPMEFGVLSLSAVLVLLVTFQSINYHVPCILIWRLEVKVISTAEHV